MSSINGRRIAVQGRGFSRLMALAIAGAAMVGGTSYVSAATTYNYIFPSPGGASTDWATGTDWTAVGTANANNYPGGDSTVLDDIASIVYTGNPAGGGVGAIGANIITLSAPLPAASIGSLIVTMTDQTTTDSATLNLNANLTVTGAATFTGGTGTGNLKNGKVIVNVGASSTFTVGGTLTLKGADGLGSATMVVNGNISLGGLAINDDGDNFTLSNTTGTANLGNVNIGRSVNNGSATSPGLHMDGGTITANNFLLGTNNSSAVAELSNASLTIAGNFIVGDNVAASPRSSNFFQSSGNVTAANSTLQIGANANQTNGTYNLSGTGTLSVLGIQLTSGAAINKANVTLSGTPTLYVGTGGIAIGPGVYTFTSTATNGLIGAMGSWSSPANMALTSGNMTFQAANASGTPFNISLSGALNGGATVTKTGGGNLSLAGVSTYSGGTTVNAGGLYVNNATGSGTGTGPVTVNAATLGGGGIITGNVTLNSLSHLAPGNNNVGTLALGNLTLSSGTILDFDFNTSANSLLNLTGNLVLSGTADINVYQEGTLTTFATNGNYTLFNIPSGVPANFNNMQVVNGNGTVSYTLTSTGTAVILHITGGTGTTGWANDVSGSWGDNTKWNGGIPGGVGSTAILGNVLSTRRTVTLDGNRTIGILNLNSSFGYTIAQGTSGALIFDNGAGNATINNFAGPHIISAPVTLNSATTVNLTTSADTVNLSGLVSGAGNLTVAGAGTLILSGNGNTYSGTTTISSGVLQVGGGGTTGSLGNGPVVNTAGLVFNINGPVTSSNTISGIGNVTQAGTGVLTLSGNNSYTGITNINAGTVAFGSATGLSSVNVNIGSAGKLDLNGNSVSVTTLSGTGIIDNTAAANTTLTFASSTVTYGGKIQNTGGNLSVVRSGSSTLILSGNNTYTGGTTVSSTGFIRANSATAFGTGTLTISSTSSGAFQLGNGITFSNPIVVADGTSSEFVDSALGNSFLASNITVTSGNQYRLGFANTTNTLTMTGASTTGSATTILTRGTIVFASNGSLISSSQPIVLGRSSAAANLTVTIQDNAIVRGVGIDLGGLNSTSDDGVVTVNVLGNGTLDAGTGAFILNNSDVTGSISFNTSGNATIRGGSFVVSGSKPTGGTLWQLDGTNLVATAGDTSSRAFMPANTNLTVALLAGGVTVNDGGFAITIAQPLIDFGGGGVTKTGTGTLTLSGANAYSGLTTVSAGKLFVDSNAGNNVTVNATGTIGGKGAITGDVNVNSGGHIAAGDGAVLGTLAISGNLNLNGSATIDVNAAFDGSNASLIDLQAGALNLTGSNGINVYQAGTASPFSINGVYNIVQFDAGFPGIPALPILNGRSGVSYVLGQNGNDLTLTISGGNTAGVWGVDADGSWAATGSWTGGVVPNAVGDVASFGSIITGPHSVTLDGNKTVGTIVFNNANAYTINPGSGGTLTIDNGVGGTSSTAISNINDLLGSHTINVPMTLTSNSTIATVSNTADTLTLAGPIGGVGSLTTAGPGKVVLSGSNNFAGTLSVTGTGNTTLSGNNSFGGLSKSGSGTLLVSGANTYSGPTTLNGGVVKLSGAGTLGNASALTITSGTLDLNGTSIAIGSLSGAGTIDNVAGAGNSVLTTGSLNANVTYSGVIQNTTGTVGITKLGSGTLVLSGTNTYTGPTTLTNGVLSVSAGSNLGNNTGTVMNFNGGTLQVTGTTYTSLAATRTVNWGANGGGFDIVSPTNNFTVSAPLSGTGGLTKAGAGTLTLTGNYTATGPIALSSGNLSFAATANTRQDTGVMIKTSNLSIASTSILDISNHDMIIGNTTPATVFNEIANAFGFGPGGAQITSSTVVNNPLGNTFLAVLDANLLGGVGSTWDNVTITDPNSVIIKYTYFGDLNFDGIVDSGDYAVIDGNFGTGNSWITGDANLDGVVDAGDYAVIDGNFGAGTQFGTPLIATPSTVPEPTSLLLLALPAASLLKRRRKHH